MQQQVQQSIQRAMNLCQQTLQELQMVSQQVQSTSNYAYASQASTTSPGMNQYTPSYGSYGSYAGGYQGGYSSGAVNNVMAADRYVDQQESMPSYHNYNTQTPSYSASQSVNYTSQVNPSAVQSVMSADRYASQDGSMMQGMQNPQGTQGYGYSGVNAVMQADRTNIAY